MLKDLVLKTRSYRRFKQTPIREGTLRLLVDLGRLAASGGNKQPLKFIISCDPETNARIFPCTLWAALIKDWSGPAQGERPTGYIIILHDLEVSRNEGLDHGIAAQNICLGAMERGLGACMIGSIKRDELRAELSIPERYRISLIVALGEPGETVVLEDLKPGGDSAYYRSADGVHHVPKRRLDDVLLPLAGGKLSA